MTLPRARRLPSTHRINRVSFGLHRCVVSIRAPRALIFSVEAHSRMGATFCPESITTTSAEVLFSRRSHRLGLIIGYHRFPGKLFHHENRYLPPTGLAPFGVQLG